MPLQIFHVLRCYKCAVFQVHQAKKSNKWACKLCGEKQSVKRHYGVGTGKECRLHIQRLNGLRGDLEDSKTLVDSDISDSADEGEDKAQDPIHKSRQVQKSRWSNFVENEPEQNDEGTSTMYLNDVKVVLEPPKKRKYGRRVSKTSNFSKHNSAHNNLSDDDHCQNSGIGVGNICIVNETRFKKKKFVPPTLQTNPKWESIKQESKEITSCGDLSHDFQSYKLAFDERPKRQMPNVMQPLNKSEHCEDSWTNKFSDTKVTHSKWSQFVDEEVKDDDNGSEDSEIIDLNANNSFKSSQMVSSNVADKHGDTKENLQTLFTLSDDYDLDNVLDF